MKKERLILITTVDNVPLEIDLDTIDSVRVTLNSVVTEYPLVDGDSISDHMYRQPASISISGMFGQQGRFSNTFSSFGNRLKAIQSLFEKIKDERLFVNILSLYNTRENYVLHHITWNEGASTLDYEFSFKQVYVAELEDVKYTVDVVDENLPILTEPKTLNVTDTMVDWNEIHTIVIMTLKEANLVKDEFLLEVGNFINNNKDILTVSLIVGVTGLAISAKIISGAIIASASIPVAGWVIGIVGVVALGIYVGLGWLRDETNKSKYALEAFKLYKKDAQKKAEFERFTNFIGSIHRQIQILEEYAKVYTFTSNENQECMININGSYYILKLIRNNVTLLWSLTVTDMYNKCIKTVGELKGLRSINDANQSNNLFTTEDGVYVYLLNKQITYSEATVKLRERDVDLYSDLRKFMLFVTSVDMSKWSTLLSDIIKNAITV
jgi:hypothetical protein